MKLRGLVEVKNNGLDFFAAHDRPYAASGG